MIVMREGGATGARARFAAASGALTRWPAWEMGSSNVHVNGGEGRMGDGAADGAGKGELGAD